MSRTAYYLTHPQVLVDADTPVEQWSLNEVGAARVSDLVERISTEQLFDSISHIICSGETKAIETAEPLAAALGCKCEIKGLMHENDRSAAGFLPPDEFEQVADQFFAKPEESVRGWEKAIDAQIRILDEVELCLSAHTSGDILFVGHGAVGTLLYCAMSQNRIDRKFDQGSGGGGNYFAFDIASRKALHHWRKMEELTSISVAQA